MDRLLLYIFSIHVTILLYIGTIVIKGLRNSLYGPGGGTLRLHHFLLYGDEIGST